MKVLGEWKNVCVQGEGTGLLRLEERTGGCWIALYAQLSAGDAVQEKASAAVDAIKEDPVTAAGAALTAAASSAVKAIGVALGADSHVMRRTPGFENDFAKEFSQTFAETSVLVMRKRLIFEKNLSNLTNCSRSGNTVSLEIGQNYRLAFEDQKNGEDMSRGFSGALESTREMIKSAQIKRARTEQGIEWTLDDDGLLTIQGLGKMPEWEYSHDDRSADTPWYEYRNDIKAVHISVGFMNIGNYAFYECKNLTSVDIPDSVTVIGHHAFCSCENLANIHIPNGVAEIQWDTFCGCEKLRSIEIPNGVVSIGSGAFDYCKSLTNIVIPDSVTEIKDYVFSSCENLTNIHIPNGITRIHAGTFMRCENLKHIEIPNSVTSISGDAFFECKRLTEIRIPNSVTELGFGIFLMCKNLKRVYMPKRFDSPLFSLRFGISKEKVTFT